MFLLSYVAFIQIWVLASLQLGRTVGSRIWAFDWYQNRWPWMTLNGEVALILRYFTEFGSFWAHCVKVVDKAIIMDNLLLICPVVNVFNCNWKFCSRFINSRLNGQYLPSYRLHLCVHMCVYICIYLYLYVYICLYVFMCLCTCVCMCVSVCFRYHVLVK